MSVRPQAELNRGVLVEGDRYFLGVDASTAPEMLEPGMVSRGTNTRFRSKRLRGRPMSRLTGLMAEEFFPWVAVAANSVELEGTVTDGVLEFTSGALDAAWVFEVGGVTTLELQGYTHVRFETGRVMRITDYTSDELLGVEDEAYHAEDASGVFVIVKDWRANPYPRTVIYQAGQTAIESGIFSDPNGYEYGLVATQTSCWGFRDYERPFEVSVPGGIPDGVCDIIQAFDQVLLARGDDLPVLAWDGGAGNAFAAVTSTSSGSYTVPVPNARMGVFVKDRVFWVVGRDEIVHSDIGVYTRYKAFESGFRPNVGTSDSITCVYPYGDEAFLVGYARSIYLVYNISGDLSNLSSKLISAHVGIAGRHAICGTGDDIWFMDIGGNLWPLSRVDETRQQVGGKPVGWPIKPQMDEAGFQHPEQARLTGHGDLVLVAFAGTGATVDTMPSGRELVKANYVAVYDRVTERWAGLDYWAYFDLTGWFVTRYGSVNQLLFCGKYGGIYQYASGSGETAWTATTRGYAMEAGAEEYATTLAVQVHSQGASLTVRTLRDGVGTAQTLEAGLERSRLKWLAHGRPDWDPSNADLDFEAPDRQDYSLVPDDDANGILLTSEGQHTHLLQSTVERYDLDGFNQWLQVELTNNNNDSQLAIGAVKVEAVPAGGDYGTD